MNVLLTWKLPNVSNRQRPIAGVIVEFRVSPVLDWTVQDTIAPDAPQQLRFSDVPAGTHYYRVTVVDDADARGAPAETSVEVGYDDPGTVTELVATLE